MHLDKLDRIYIHLQHDLELEHQLDQQKIRSLEEQVEDWKNHAQQTLEELQRLQDKQKYENEEDVEMQRELEMVTVAFFLFALCCSGLNVIMSGYEVNGLIVICLLRFLIYFLQCQQRSKFEKLCEIQDNSKCIAYFILCLFVGSSILCVLS